jgi:hypothetical protein
MSGRNGNDDADRSKSASADGNARTHAFDQQCVCAVLQCLWEKEVSSFKTRALLVPSFADENARSELINKLNLN